MKYINKKNKEGKVIKLKDYKRRAKMNKLKRKLLLVFVLLLILVIILCFTPLLQIKTINCTGNSKVSTEEIIAASKIDIGDNLIRTSKRSAINSIDDISYIKSVKITKKFPSTINIEVVECDVYSYIVIGKKYILINEDAKVLEISDTVPKPKAPVLKTAKITSYNVNETVKFEDSTQLSIYMSLVKNLENSVFADIITNIDISDINKVSFTVNNQITIILDDINKMDYEIHTLAEGTYNSPECPASGILRIIDDQVVVSDPSKQPTNPPKE